ncbi:hypothetical protein BD779DRAFT_1517995 [Infundibulicybe gibba]|nr:hypothetical protein BD779DRAFT_1517995 [Infundibulicybe gibba]
MTLRVYALYGCSLRVLGSMITVGIAGTCVSCWALFFAKNTTVAQPMTSCHIGLSYDTSTRFAITWESVFAYDLIIFVLTLTKTWRAGRNMGMPLITLFLRDGNRATYFAVTTLSNLANILTFYFCGPFLRGGLSTFSSSISATMMSRFILNLHETASVGIFSTHINTRDRVSRLEFVQD